jgi:hypothetical protein
VRRGAGATYEVKRELGTTYEGIFLLSTTQLGQVLCSHKGVPLPSKLNSQSFPSEFFVFLWAVDFSPCLALHVRPWVAWRSFFVVPTRSEVSGAPLSGRRRVSAIVRRTLAAGFGLHALTAHETVIPRDQLQAHSRGIHAGAVRPLWSGSGAGMGVLI